MKPEERKALIGATPRHERMYTLVEVATILNFCREHARRMVKDRTDILRYGKQGHYRVPASVLERIKQEMAERSS